MVQGRRFIPVTGGLRNHYEQVVTDISGDLIEDDEAKVRMLMSQQ